ncbi:hypothetical protein [Streptomyces sp. NPDC060002]|uniref:hypothetical protein n=1 Tax=Streptomyces sp. NPDC060002 TaxID=3347033 RepID=UPI003697F1C3
MARSGGGAESTRDVLAARTRQGVPTWRGARDADLARGAGSAGRGLTAGRRRGADPEQNPEPARGVVAA